MTAGVLVLGTAAWGVSSYVSSGPQRSNQDFQDGMRLMRPGTYPQAIERFSRAIRTSRQVAVVYLERGTAHRYLNQPDQALSDFDAAIQADPSLARAYIERASVYRQRGKAAQAIEELTKSLSLEESPDAYYERGQTYESVGEHRKAIDDYDSALSWLRNSPEVYRARSLAKKRLGDIVGYEADQVQARISENRR